MWIILSMKNKLIEIISKNKDTVKNESTSNITCEEVKIINEIFEEKCSKNTVSIDKNPFSLTMEDLRKISIKYDISHFAVSRMNKWQKYKNRYSRALMEAKYMCKQHGK